MSIDVHRLSCFIADQLQLESVNLQPLKVQCAWPVYRATAIGCTPMFIKVTERLAAERTLAFLESVEKCPFLPKARISKVLDFEEKAILCLDWKESKRVNAEDMTENQLASFASGCHDLATVLARYQGSILPRTEEDSLEGQYAALRHYAERHSILSWFLSPLLAIPDGERTYGERKLTIIHGDLQPKNYGFDGDKFAAVYDTDDITEGLACEDACYAFTERARRSELSTAKRRRLTDLFLRLVELSPWPKDEWLIAVNHSRLRIAARRLANHPDSVFIAFDIARRDKPLRMLEQALKGASC